jgi:hypothetical protein
MSVKESNISNIYEAALAIAARRHDMLARLRAALERGDDAEALNISRQLCGLDYVKECDRVN